MLLALVLGVVSCQNEPEGLDVVVGGEQEVMLNVSLPESTRGTSAQGFDFTNFAANDNLDLRFILEIRYQNGNETKVVRDVKTSETTSATFPVRLAPKRVYTFTVWADLVKQGPEGYEAADLFYDTTSLQDITLKTVEDEDIRDIVELRDAYTHTDTFNFTEDRERLNMTLVRPFAKVRVVATDLDKVTKFGIIPDNAAVVYTSDIHNSFNAVTGDVNEDKGKPSFTYNISANDYGEVVENQANDRLTVFADYIFVPTTENIQPTVTFTLNVNAENGLIKSNSFNTAIPVERNKVTSIVGDVLTEGGNVSITINGTLEEKETIKYVDNIVTLQDVINAAENGKQTTIKLGGNVVIDNVTTRAEQQYGLVIPAGKIIVLDLNGKSISQTKKCVATYSMITNNGELTILDSSAAKSGKISFKDSGEGDSNFTWGVYTINNTGNLIVNGGTIENISAQNRPGNIVHMYCAIQQGNSTAVTTINDGVIRTPSYRSVRATNGEVVINGGVFEGQVWMQSDYHHTKLTINGGQFEPKGGDGSSIFITNTNADGTTVKINGGHFMTKIGCSNPTKDDVKGCITGGTFTTVAKENTNEALLANGYGFVEGEDGNYTVASLGYYKDANGNYHITGAKGWLWMADQNDTFFRNKTIYLDNDIDFADVDMRVTRMWTDEYSATFDGQNHTVSNIWMASDYDKNNQALFDGLMTVKNLTVTNAQVYGMSQVGIIGANISGTIENCHVKKSRAYGYVWQVGGIVGLHSWGEIKNCSVEDTKIECFYYGAVGAIAGCMNEMSRNITNCTVKNCQLIKEGTYPEYSDYDSLFGAFAGYIVPDGTYVFSGEIENTTTKVNGVTTDSAVYGEAPSSANISYNGAYFVNSTDSLATAISNGATEFMLTEGIYVIPNSAAGKTLHFIGMGNPANTKIATNNETGSYEGCNYNLSGSTVTFENISINTTSTSYIGYAGLKATYKNCIINGFYCLYDNSTFEDCTFNVSGDNYNIWTWGAPVATFTRCTFNCDGKSVMLYGGANTTLTVNNCTFNDNGGLVDELKAAIEVGNDYNMSYELIVNNTIVNGFAINNKGINTGTTLWANKNSMPQDKLNVVVDGVDVY